MARLAQDVAAGTGGQARQWSAINPKPLIGDREFDLVPLLRNRWQVQPDPAPGWHPLPASLAPLP